MHKTDYLAIDGKLLTQFLAIYDFQSVSRAAQYLNINQSSASHALERLRKILDDPLFVRSGRGLIPTERADTVALDARLVLAKLEAMSTDMTYDPSTDKGEFTIMANDYEIEHILKPVFPLFQQQAPELTIRIIHAISGLDIPTALREGVADLAINPDIDIDATDIRQKRLISDFDVVYYDPSQRSAPSSVEEYCNARHGIIVLGDIKKTEADNQLVARGKERKIAIKTSSFNVLASLVRGTDIITTMPSRLSESIFNGLAQCPSPIDLAPYSIVQLWHQQNSHSARHKWVRETIQSPF
ncbi:LysR family transcriptional regulator [Vibrio penaeicida]|uniref:LysR family transcriptional regulator n=1 Tax=Vibrio penaeicida TaxID=104609 RepID=UPI0027338231|nr:LysR family transcriptional regulator [Vibrio penaeicida]MDP2572116.1 LysR family transcriptional regulator [Vibrio penaeicida]